MKLSVVLAAALVCASTPPSKAGADGGGGKAKTSLEAKVRAMLPKGWSLETRGLPDGVVALFAGPSNEAGQATVTVTQLEGETPRLTDENDRHALAERLAASGLTTHGPSVVIDASVRADGPLGGPSVETRLDGLVVRQLLVPGPVSYLVTIAAPEALYFPVLKEVRAMARALSPKPALGKLAIEPSLRSDEVPRTAKEASAAD